MSKRDPLDVKYVSAWDEIPEAVQFEIRTALLKPTRIGAIVNGSRLSERNVKTSLGYVVHSGLVTPLARAMLDAIAWEQGPSPPEKPKRTKRSKEAA